MLEEVNDDTPRYIIYKAALLDRLDRHQEAIGFIQTQSNDSQELDSRQELILNLTLLTSYASNNKYDQCEKLFYSLYENKKFTQHPEYGYLLRNSEIILSFDESINFIQRSIEHFNALGMLKAAAHTRIRMAMQLARIGKLNKALEELNLAEEALLDKTMERHIIFNDRATIYMLMGKYDDEVFQLLRKSFATATTTFDNIVISFNLLSLLTQIKDTESGFQIVNNLLDLLKEQPDRNMHLDSYYAIANYYKMIGNLDKHSCYLEKSSEYITFEDTYWKSRLYGGEMTDSDYDFMATKPFNPGFISYWHFDIGDCLSNY